MFDLKNPEIDFAIQTVRQAALLVQQVQAQLITPALMKDDRSPVTVADFAAQALVGARLSDVFPSDLVVAEESAAGLRTEESAGTLGVISGFLRAYFTGASAEQVCSWIDHGRADGGHRFWTLDPIDGTKGFLRGDQYAVALALVIDGQVQIGVLGCPNLEEACHPNLHGEGSLVVAVRGQGTWTTSLHVTDPVEYRRLRVSETDDPARARVLRSFESGHTNVDRLGNFSQVLGARAEPVRMDSQAKYAVLAAGGGELLLRLLSAAQPDYKEKIWDQAAGSLVLEEAGGMITDLTGQPLDFSSGRSLIYNRGVLASNRRLHAAALDALRQVGA